MRALTYQGSKNVKVETVGDPKIIDNDDIILQVTATAICGSDLHLYGGTVPEMKDGDILGHEFMGIVVDAGRDVNKITKGDRVVIPFVIACGSCFFCSQQEYAACEVNVNKKSAVSVGKNIKPSASLFGFSHLYGGIPGGQAEYVRVPRANVGPIKIPSNLKDEQVLFLSDILPTGYQAALNADIKPGSTVAIFGAGPVGLMSAACAKMLGAEKIFMIDEYPYRLDFAQKEYNIIPINFKDLTDPASFIIEKTQNRGVDAVIDAVGYESKGSASDALMQNIKLEDSSGYVLRQCIGAVRRCGIVSVPGVYIGLINRFTFGDAFDKGITFKMGQTHVQKLMPELLQFIEQGLLKPANIITHVLPLEEAAKGYDLFYKKEESCRKVVLKP